jgi:pimeloyl-ACP methyl ester carboxylesterase
MSIARRGLQRLAVMFLLLLGAGALAAIGAPASAADKIGIVLMHGEQGAPGRVIDGLGQALEKADYLVGRPDMCWSTRRAYEATFPECLALIDDAIVKLKNLGASAIVVGGFSLGGNAAIAYGADHGGLLGIFAIAPAHDALALTENADVAASIAHASELVAAGKDDETATFIDIAFGPAGPYATEIATTPAIYLSFFGPASRANIPDNARKLAAPLLWVAGADDPTQSGGPGYAFARAPANPLNRYVTVAGGHTGAPDKAKDAVLAWLKILTLQ